MSMKWIGNIKGAAGIVGIPARDLNGDEVKRYGGEKALLATGLYTKPAERVVQEVVEENIDKDIRAAKKNSDDGE